MFRTFLLAALLGLPFLASACGDTDGPVSREEAAPCAEAVAGAQMSRGIAKEVSQRAWRGRWPDIANPSDYIIRGPRSGEFDDPYPSSAPTRDYYAEVRAECSQRVFSVALAAKGIETFTIRDACRYDPYRESQLCADVPQPGAG